MYASNILFVLRTKAIKQEFRKSMKAETRSMKPSLN